MTKEDMVCGKKETRYTHTARVAGNLCAGTQSNYTEISTTMEEMAGETIFIRETLDTDIYDWVGRPVAFYGREWWWMTEWLEDITPLNVENSWEEEEDGD